MVKFPNHLSLELSHNDHKNCYYTVLEQINNHHDYYGIDNWVSQEQYDRAINDNDMWTLHWYPETPVGFCVLHAADLDVLLKAALND